MTDRTRPGDDEVNHTSGNNPPTPSWAPDSEDETGPRVEEYACTEDHEHGEGLLLILRGVPETDKTWMHAATEDLLWVEP